jgi:hypothetical protein
LFGKRLDDLDTVHFLAEFAQDGRLVARAGADVQGPRVGSRTRQLSHQRHDVRLRNRLIPADRQRAVCVSRILQVVWNIQVARNPPHRLQHALVRNVPATEMMLDHVPPSFEEPIVFVRHRGSHGFANIAGFRLLLGFLARRLRLFRLDRGRFRRLSADGLPHDVSSEPSCHTSHRENCDQNQDRKQATRTRWRRSLN